MRLKISSVNVGITITIWQGMSDVVFFMFFKEWERFDMMKFFRWNVKGVPDIEMKENRINASSPLEINAEFLVRKTA